jgi:uncharacterized membrane protein HdeD (DUF308 family)
MAHTPADMLRQASTASILWGALLIVFGLAAITLPFVAAIAVNALVAWLIVLAGAVHLILGFRAHSAGSLIWKLLVGLAYLAFGIYLFTHPVTGIASLALVLASLFLLEGLFDIVLFFNLRPLPGSSMVLVDAIITLVLAGMIYAQWPSSASWAIGTLVGVSMLVSGITRVMLSLTVRKAAGTAQLPPAKAA